MDWGDRRRRWREQDIGLDGATRQVIGVTIEEIRLAAAWREGPWPAGRSTNSIPRLCTCKNQVTLRCAVQTSERLSRLRVTGSVA